MKRTMLFALLAAIFFAPLGHAQNKLDFWLRHSLQEYRSESATASQKPSGGAIFRSASGKILVEAIIQSENGDFSSVEQQGGVLRTVAGPYATCLIPLSAVEELVSHPRIQYVAVATELRPLNDIATRLIGIKDAIRSGYTGEEVLIGVIDTGIDLKHPGFRNAQGTRVLYLWDQTLTGQRPAFPRYDYGAEWSKQQIDNDECPSKDTVGHGTHIAGCIAQNVESGRDTAFSAGAIASNLVIVKTDFLSTHILDGINYIFEKARQAGKPAIVNLSLGSQFGPHDGTDPISAARDFLSGPGRIVVQSAGNDADKAIHHQVDADANGEDMRFTSTAPASILEFEMWYGGNRKVDLRVIGPNGNPSVSIPFGASGAVAIPGGTLTADNASNGPEFYNNDNRIGVKLEGSVQPGTWIFRLTSTTPVTVHAWMWNGDEDAGFRFATSDAHYALVDGACGRTVIAVGAYVTRNRFRVKNVEGIPDGTELASNEVLNTVASFSSGGPTRDGRQKPDIVAPGSYIVSALSGDIDWGSIGSRKNDFRSEGQYYQFMDADQQLVLQGTSPASGVGTSVSAYILAQDDQIDPQGLQDVLKNIGRCVTTAYAEVSSSDMGSRCAWDYRAGYGLINLGEILAGREPIRSAVQVDHSTIQVSFNTILPGMENSANYEIDGASNVNVISVTRSGNVMTLTLDGTLVEGFRDQLRITGLTGQVEPYVIEIDKFGKIVDLDVILTNLIWHADESPYYVHGDVQLLDTAGDQPVRLTIEPGTVVKFMPNAGELSQLTIFGELIAQGTAERPIIFTSLNETTAGAWGGLYFDDGIPPTHLRFCEIRFADNGVSCLSDNLTIENCTIAYSLNSGFWAQDCSPKIKDTVIHDSKGGDFTDGIQLINASSATTLEGVRSFNNDRFGIFCSSASPQIRNCILAENFEGIRLQGSSAETRILNSTIHGNSSGGIINLSSSPGIINCIVTSNTGTGIHSQNGTPPTVTYSDVWNNSPDFDGVAPVTGMISSDPRFINALERDFRLEQNSPCIDKGDPSTEFKDLDGTRADMGAVPRLAELAAFNAATLSAGIELTWSANQNERVKGVIILRAESEPVNAVLENGKSYQAGDILGNSTVIYSVIGAGDPGRLVDLEVEIVTAYHYAAWAIYERSVYSDAPRHSSAVTTSIAERENDSLIPTSFALHPNYPNPFNPATTIGFDLPKESEVDIRVFNLQGQLVKVLVHERRAAGRYTVAWDSGTATASAVSSGIYVIQMHTDEFEKSIKTTLIK